MRKLACSRVPVFQRPRPEPLESPGQAGAGLTRKPQGEGRRGSLLASLSGLRGPSGREVKGKALWPRFQYAQWLLCPPCCLFPCPPHLHGLCSAPLILVIHLLVPRLLCVSSAALTDLQSLSKEPYLFPAIHPWVSQAQETGLGKNRMPVAL